MEFADFDEYPEMLGVEWAFGPLDVTTISHKGCSEHDMTTAISGQGLSSPYAQSGKEGGATRSPCAEPSQSHLGLAFVLPPALASTDARLPVIPSGLEPGHIDQAISELKQRPRISPAKWQQIRPTFATLYRDQYKTLAETMRILEEEHGFKASEKLFKDKIKAWGLRKNLKRLAETTKEPDSKTPPEPLDESPQDLMADNDVKGLASLPSNNAKNTIIETCIDYQRKCAGDQAYSGRTGHSGYSLGSEFLAETSKEIMSRLDMAFAKIQELELRMKAYHG